MCIHILYNRNKSIIESNYFNIYVLYTYIKFYIVVYISLRIIVFMTKKGECTTKKMLI